VAQEFTVNVRLGSSVPCRRLRVFCRKMSGAAKTGANFGGLGRSRGARWMLRDQNSRRQWRRI